MNKREFLKQVATLSSIAILPSGAWSRLRNKTLRTAHIGVGGKGRGDLRSISSHQSVQVVALCDVDKRALKASQQLHPGARVFQDYRKMFDAMAGQIDAVVVSTPDHTHAPASLLAMELGKSIYCQKPLTRYVSEARAIRQLAKDHQLITQMGIQIHSEISYRSAVILLQSGLIGKVKRVHAWSPKNWGFDGKAPRGEDPVPSELDWNLWLGTAPYRPYQEGVFHPNNWRKLIDYGCGTLGDMGVHIFDTPFTALDLDFPKTITNTCREPNDWGHPERNKVVYEFPGTRYTSEILEWIWSDGEGAPEMHPDLQLPSDEELPSQGAMFVGQKGNLLLPHWDLPKLIVEDKYEAVDYPPLEEISHYHQFVDACLEEADCSTPFSYAARLTEAVLLGVVAGRFPNETLHWNDQQIRFEEERANVFLSSTYRKY